MSRYGNSITEAHQSLPRAPFCILGALDGLALTMQTFAAAYLPGPLLVLLSQAVIPCTIMARTVMLRSRHHWKQIAGAGLVIDRKSVV